MKKNIVMLMLLVSCNLMSTQALAAKSEVIWTDFTHYRDISEGNEGSKQFRDRTFKNFEKHFARLAERLPLNQTLKIKVTDVDLAGDTHLGGINRTRIIKDIYSPRMNFTYQLLGAEGSIIKSDEVVVKDMNFMSDSRLKYRNKALGYEKKMLDDWFEATFQSMIVSK